MDLRVLGGCGAWPTAGQACSGYLLEHDGFRPDLSSARDAGRQAAEAGVGMLVLTHLLPGTDRRRSSAAARAEFGGPIRVARPGLRLDVG